MRDQFVGDIGDFAKYGLLRTLICDGSAALDTQGQKRRYVALSIYHPVYLRARERNRSIA